MTIAPPEVTLVDSHRVSCDGASGIRSGAGYRAAALGHPLVYLEIAEAGFIDCGYCDRRFVLRGGPADSPAAGTNEAAPHDIAAASDPGHR